jgi:hypothetical protein
MLPLENLLRHGLGDITVTGTCLEYGMQEGALGEELSPRPGNPMRRPRIAPSAGLEEWQENPFMLKWVRLFYMYGKGQNPKSLLSQLDKALE